MQLEEISRNSQNKKTTLDEQSVVYNISPKRESLDGFEVVDLSTLQDLKDRLKITEDKCYNLNRDIGSLETKMEGWEKWKWIIIAAVASPLILSVYKSIIEFK